VTLTMNYMGQYLNGRRMERSCIRPVQLKRCKQVCWMRHVFSN